MTEWSRWKYSKAERERWQARVDEIEGLEAQRQARRAEADRAFEEALEGSDEEAEAAMRRTIVNHETFLESQLDPRLPLCPVPRWRTASGGGYTELKWWMLVLRVGAFTSLVVAVIAALILGIAALVRQISWTVAHNNCPNQGEALQVEYRWADYSYWSWDCLANVQGRWVPIGTVNNDTGLWLR